jgi:hypothetical protein
MEYEEIVRRDIEIHGEILDFCTRTPWIRDNMNMIVSKYPWQDICVLVTIAFCWGLFEIGPHFFWVCAINLGISFGKDIMGSIKSQLILCSCLILACLRVFCL